MKVIIKICLTTCFTFTCILGFGQSLNYPIDSQLPQFTQRPIFKDSLKINLEVLSNIRLYHSLTDKRVKHINPTISEITNPALKIELDQLFKLINSAQIDSNYIGGSPKYDKNLELKVIFLNYNTNIYNKTYPTLELFLANEGTSFTLREYYYVNKSNYYVLDSLSTEKIIDKIELLVNEFTSFNTSLKPWSGEKIIELEIEDIE
jgi:hypothetical protein